MGLVEREEMRLLGGVDEDDSHGSIWTAYRIHISGHSDSCLKTTNIGLAAITVLFTLCSSSCNNSTSAFRCRHRSALC